MVENSTKIVNIKYNLKKLSITIYCKLLVKMIIESCRSVNYVAESFARMFLQTPQPQSAKSLKRRKMHQPGIEPRSVPWQGTIITMPLVLVEVHGQKLSTTSACFVFVGLPLQFFSTPMQAW